MATITGLTAARMLDIEAGTVVDGDIVGDDLVLVRHDGVQINAGNVRGAVGPQGPPSSDLDAVTGIPVLDVGLVNQIRAGRQLTVADFTNMGLTAPIGLWNLTDVNDISGNGHAFVNKGGVTFNLGVNGVTGTSARFTGVNTKAFYIVDSGVNDPFRIRSGSMGCWFRTTKRGAVNCALMSKWGAVGNQGYLFYTYGNVLNIATTVDGTNMITCNATSDVADERWHFGVVVIDGSSLSVYVDGALEGRKTAEISLFQSSAPFNIGASAADATTLSDNTLAGRVDEAFITRDILTEDQVRYLYCARIPHALGSVPSRVSLNIKRRRRGGAFVLSDFTLQPLRLYNFSAGALTDEGTTNAVLTSNPATGKIFTGAGVDGTKDNSYSFSGTHQGLSALSTGLPTGLVTTTMGCWFKSSGAAVAYSEILSYGAASDMRFLLHTDGTCMWYNGTDLIQGPFVADGEWHYLVGAADNTATDGLKRKLYLDGRLIGSSIVYNALGVGVLRVGAKQDGLDPFTGSIDGVFVTNVIVGSDTILTQYNRGVEPLTASPKNPGDHVEGMTTADLLVIFDTVEPTHLVDLGVS